MGMLPCPAGSIPGCSSLAVPEGPSGGSPVFSSQERGAWHRPEVASTSRLSGASPLGALLLPEAPIPRESFTGEALGCCSNKNLTINEG